MRVFASGTQYIQQVQSAHAYPNNVIQVSDSYVCKPSDTACVHLVYELSAYQYAGSPGNQNLCLVTE